MSQENVEMVRRAYRHVSRTGQLLPEVVHPAFVWDTTMFGGLNPERCVGVDETNRWLARWIGTFNDWSVDVEEVIDGGDQVVAIVRQRGTAGHGGPEVEMRFAQVFTFRDGLVVRVEMYADRAAALEAAGIQE
jgi:ketosteroid isomerase-like protein